ncbi:FG-GAP-like repeat-containing protein [Candidatus Uabimicrobium sp. HlEnr_7]|uniref:FG-GAP-like repeat-containing protein n=1 Tax=Candidatus Uabimicrobium helgolandensis TaxID=3095367 RepID=UPI0035590CF6
MKSIKSIILLLFIVIHIQAEILTYSGATVESGNINGIDVSGEGVTVSVEINDGLFFENGSADLGTPLSITYEFSNFGTFKIDNIRKSVITANRNAAAPFFFDEQGFIYSSPAQFGSNLLASQNGESITDYATRIASFTNRIFSIPFPAIKTGVVGNNGNDTITQEINYTSGNVITLSIENSPNLSPRQLKENAITTLSNITTTDPKLKKIIDSARLSVEKSLTFKEQPLFIDGFRISAKDGAKVFSNSKKAAIILAKSIDKDTTAQPIKDTFQRVVDSLVLSDKNIADLSLQTAQSMIGVLEVKANLFGRSVEKFTSGEQETNAGKAIAFFGQSWVFSQKAVFNKLKNIAITSFSDSPDPFDPTNEQNILSATVRLERLAPKQFLDFTQVIKDSANNIVRTIVVKNQVSSRSIDIEVQSIWDGRNNKGDFVDLGDYSYIAYAQLFTLKNGLPITKELSFPIAGNIAVVSAAPAPDIESIDPAQGNSTGGTSVTIIGSNFENGATVFFGANEASNVVITSSQITCTTPPETPKRAVVNVTVTNSDNQSDTLNNAFSYRNVNSPQVKGLARYQDINRNKIADSGDVIIIPFDQSVVLNNNANVADEAFTLPVTGDNFGANSSLSLGDVSNEIKITLGSNPSLKTRQLFTLSSTTANSASGIDINPAITDDLIEGVDGTDASASTAIDIIPGFVDSEQNTGQSSTVSFIDIERDGDLDIIFGNDGNQTNQVFVNDGSGNYSSGSSFSVGDTRAVAVGDVDKDGDFDIVFANSSGQNNEVFFNDGTGNFSLSQSLGTSNTVAVAIVDIDKDGDFDLIFANSNDQDNEIFVNNGLGNFSLGQAVAFGDTRSVAVGDVDKDGDVDLIFGNSSGQANQIFLNNGFGNFSDSGQDLGNENTQALALGDIDQDGDLDLVFANSQQNQIFVNDGVGNFSNSGKNVGADNSTSLVVIDIDGDSDLDIVFGNNDQSDQVFHNNGKGNFTPSEQNFSAIPTKAIIIGDIDNDGDMDLVTAGQNKILQNSLSGTWGSATFVKSGQNLGSGNTRFFAAGDFDSDGDLDFFRGNGNSSNALFINDGSGNFTVTQNFSGDTLGIAIGDIDGDGDLDAVFGNANSQPNQVMINDGNGNFTAGQELGNSSTFNIDLGDVDGDGDLDIIAGNRAPDKIYLNNGSGVFTDSGQALDNFDSCSNVKSLHDFDNDGDLDYISTNLDNESIHLYSNDGSGIFTRIIQIPSTGDTRSAVVGDLDNDGDLDIIQTNNGQGNHVYLNNGNFNFVDTGQILSSGFLSRFSVLGDINGDGSLDIAIANGFGPEHIFFNNGSAIFTLKQSIGNINSFSANMADIDNDGDLDLFIGVNTGLQNILFLNK